MDRNSDMFPGRIGMGRGTGMGGGMGMGGGGMRAAMGGGVPGDGGGFGGSSDRSVQATNDDATISKLSCVQQGYFEDNFVRHFVRRPTRRSPVIHRGYFARWAGLRVLVDQFLGGAAHTQGGPGAGAQGSVPLDGLQIVSLGSGYDTLFFQLKEEGRAPGKYIEIDFPEVTSKKAAILNARPQLSECLEDFRMAPELCGVVTKRYVLAAADLREEDKLQAVLEAAGADTSAPTLILAECVLIYMDPPSSDRLVQWAARAFSHAAFVTYEQIRPDDAFGEQMMQNLEIRGCPLLSLRHTPTLESKEDRFLRHGFEEAEAVDMDTVYSRCIDQRLKDKIEKLEIFDEFEEWHMMQEHYCIAYGIRQGTKEPFQGFGYGIRRKKKT